MCVHLFDSCFIQGIIRYDTDGLSFYEGDWGE